MENTPTPIHIQLKNKRKELGMTQIKFAERSGVGLCFLRELERGKTIIRLDKLSKVLEFHGLRLEPVRRTGIKLEKAKRNRPWTGSERAGFFMTADRPK